MGEEFKEITMQDTLLALDRLLDEFECGVKHAGIYHLSLMVNAVNYRGINNYTTGHIEYPIEMTYVTERRDVEYYFNKLRKISADLEKVRADIKYKLGLYINGC